MKLRPGPTHYISASVPRSCEYQRKVRTNEIGEYWACKIDNDNACAGINACPFSKKEWQR